ncbi:MAG: hypothetical protein NTY37_11750 [Methanothrix sp.]|nr:hypothetical protein [Methanothrix sp.]
MELNYRKIIKEFYCHAYKWRILFFLLCLLFTSIIALHGVFSWPKIVDQYIWHFWVLWILLSIILLIFPAWLNLYFRYLAWWVSQGLGIIIKWLRSGWTIAVLLVLGVASALFIRGTIINSQKNITINRPPYSFIINNATWAEPISVNWIDVLSPDFWMKVLAVLALLLLAYQAYKSRKRIVLLLFSNQTGDEELKSSIEGISSLLQNELARLTRLCNEVDDTNPYNPGTLTFNERSSSANLSVSVEESLENIVTSDTKVKLGPLEIPVGATIGLLAKVIKGPQLTGSLHKEDGRLVLIANLKGGGFNNDWRITGSDSPDQEASSVDHIAHMTQQLAYRIFADLNKESLGSTSWKAVCHYTEGLRAYKETLRTDRDKSPKLRKAEKAFLLALGEDKKFLKCYYNLGVVYFALEQPESAFSVLNKSIDPDQPEAYLSKVYYALAKSHSWMQNKRGDRADYKFSVELCDKAIELETGDARAWDFKGLLMRRYREKKTGKPLPPDDYWRKDIIPIREVATALAWREMCCCSSKNKKIENIREITVICARNLAVAYSQAHLASGKHCFGQAIYLAPSDAELYYELGKTLNNSNDWREAASVLENAVKIKEHPAYWSELSVAYANLADKGDDGYEKLALDACRRVMDSPSASKEDAFILERTETAMFKLMPSLLSLLDTNREKLNSRLSNWNWDYANALLRLAGLPSTYALISGNDYDRLRSFLIKKLNTNWIKTAIIEKIDDGYDTKIKIFDNNNYILLTFDNERSNVSFKINGKEIRDFSAKEENNKIIIYENPNANPDAAKLNKSIICLNYNIINLEKELNKKNGYKFHKLNDTEKKDLLQAIRNLRKLDPRREEISGLSQESQDKLRVSHLDYAWYCLSNAEKRIGTDYEKYTIDALIDLRENLFLHALVIHTIDQIRQNKESLDELARKLSIWDWGHDRVLAELKNSDECLYRAAVNSPRMELASQLLNNLKKIGSLENNKDKVTRLEKLKQRQMDGCWDWGYCQVLLALSYIEQKDEKKEELLEAALLILEKNSPSEIVDKGVHGQLADVLASQKKFGEALYCAQRSVSLSPERSWDRSKLSYVYQSFKDFEESSSQLEICMSIDPKDYFNYKGMAWSKLQSITQLRDMDARQKALKRYVEILVRFLVLIQNDLITDKDEAEKNVEMRSWAHFWLGYAYYELNKYDLAISNWNEAKYLSEKSAGRSHLIAMHWLGTVYLDIKAYDECELIFKELINFFEEKELNGVTKCSKEARWAYEEKAGGELIGQEFEFNNVSLGYLMAHAYLSLSFSYAQRHANLADAVSHVEKAEGYIRNVLDPDLKNELEAMHDDRKGWIIYTQVKLGEGSNNIKDAIDWLKKAVNKSASPENYLHLAMALEYKLEVEGETLQKTESGKSELQRRLDYALACCDHVIDLDLQKKYAEQAKELRKRLEKLRKSNRQ